MAQNTMPAAAPNVGPPVAPTLTLTATNNSSVPGPQYFNVFPPPLLVVTPQQPQSFVPKVSGPTTTGATPITMEWSTPAALPLIALAPGQSAAGAQQTPVTLGSTAEIAWKDNAFTVTATPGSGSNITLAYDSGIPLGSSVGLMIGPGTILLPISGTGLALTPDLTPTYTVQFGTAWQPGAPAFSDTSAPETITFSGTTAAIVVGSDNTIVQTA
jgi:hypothetical protein